MSSGEDINSETLEAANAILKGKQNPKAIRVVTVLAYALSVSMAAILLSVYYVFVWEGRPHIGARTSGGDLDLGDLNNTFEFVTHKMNESSHMKQIQEAINNINNLATTERITQNHTKSLKGVGTLDKESNNKGYSKNMQEQIEASEELEDLNVTYLTSTTLSVSTDTEDLDNTDDMGGKTLIKKLMEA